MLLAILCLVSGCSSSAGNNASDNATAAAPAVTPAPTVSAAPVPSQTSATYDVSIGSGVDGNGYANLPLRAGAHRYFVSSASGSDGNGCAAAQQPATPLRSIAAGAACVQAGNGDQVMVAEGTSYAEGLPNLDSRAGYSAAYPTVIQSYNPADPLNEATQGRAANGRRPVINTGANAQPLTCCATPGASYLAIRGFDINPGNRPDMSVSLVGSNNYVLIENNIFRYTALTFDKWNYAQATSHVVRKNAFYGSWSPTAHAQGIYDNGTDNLVVEDNVFWHTGWKVGANRDDDPSIGGPTMFRHSIYQQDTTNATIRRNLFMDPSATGCSCRGDTSISENVFIDNPLAIIAGLGDGYNTVRPNGVSIDIGYNAIIGDADINSANPRGQAITTGNGKQGSSAHNNLIVRSRNVNGVNTYAFITDANFAQPSYMSFDSNLVYQFSTTTFYSNGGSYPGQDFPTYTNNLWDTAASGTNTSSAGATYPNAYSEAQLFAALGCTDKATCAARMIETPEAGWAAKARALLWQGYGR